MIAGKQSIKFDNNAIEGFRIRSFDFIELFILI